MIFSLNEIIENAIKHSPFYRRTIGQKWNGSGLQCLPIVDQDSFWQAMQEGELLTAQSNDGVVFKSGGTTGNPKHSYFLKEEWQQFTKIFGESFQFNGMCDGDKIGNMFYAGNMYASFIFIMKSIEHSPLKLTHYPLGGGMSYPDYVKTISDLHINCLARVPTTFVNLALYE